ncbi:LysE family translocator [Pseudoalteromonas denitrificans]|uniref:Threonine/homoserine/homoserine lactone efflux protein n=1 Tax=Pseudoalteromonas denitrificans DSM 6059 TaxID=1123010 RepID=A0A1I1UJK2_9GAMM|nr:LysE family translocator [Pseudoalteromonas denitrificans]SFD70981.1 Threonine/homoserine/homoserine lactone efflux protein [Pseudoalteromonas denitrificans DSM 6059]
MSFEIWLAFIVASSVLTLIPGPCVLLVVTQALTKGMSSAFLCILGDVVGGVVLMILSLLGVGAILATSATLFTLFKWLGIIYMAYLGVCQIIEAKKNKAQKEHQNTQSLAVNSFNAGFLASLLNPKAIIFYMAFLPQFMNPQGDTLLQFSILIMTSSIVVGSILTGYALIASRTRKAFQSERSRKYFDYSGASFLIGSSVFMASTTK